MAYGPLKVLVVEDNDDVADIIREFFDEKIYTVSRHVSAEAALDFLEDQSVDLLVCDLNLPMMNGVSLLKDLEGRQQLPPKVLILSGHLQDYDKDLPFLKRFTFYEKPLFFQQLEVLVKKMTEDFHKG